MRDMACYMSKLYHTTVLLKSSSKIPTKLDLIMEEFGLDCAIIPAQEKISILYQYLNKIIYFLLPLVPSA